MITVGIPVYNEGQYIEDTILSVIDKADKIVISDNGSTDSTAEICKKYALNNEKIKYIRQVSTIDVIKNFQVCLDVSDTEYFMFLGGHDLVPENYISTLVNCLEKTDAVLAFTPVRYIADSEKNIVEEYDYFYAGDLECKDPFIRVYSLMLNLTDCSLVNGVFRTEILQKSFENTRNTHKEIGADHVLICDVAAQGTFTYNLDTFFLRRKVREENALESTLRYIKYFYKDVDLENIYTDYNNGLRNGQIEVMRQLENDDINRKNFWVNESHKVMNARFNSRISSNDYLQKWRKINETGSTILNMKEISKVVIFGTLNLAELLMNECAKANVEVVSFIDNTKSGELFDIPINNVNWLKKNENKFDTIIVSIEGAHDLKVILKLKEYFVDKKVISWKNLILYDSLDVIAN